VPPPKQVWVTDITYISTAEGWLYLADHKDHFTGEGVGYAMSERMTKKLVSQSLFHAVSNKRPAACLIHHIAPMMTRNSLSSSRCSSMNRRGNCYDNAPIESFWGMLEKELVHHRRYATRRETMQEIMEYI